MIKGLDLASDIKFYLDYSKWNSSTNELENWEQSVDRVMNMHREKYAAYLDNPRFVELVAHAEQAYKDKLVLGSQRALQFGGSPIMKHNIKMYNCIGGYIDRIQSFQEAGYFLLGGCGVGFSVQNRHISKLPNISKRTKGTKTFIIEDSIEGWSDAWGVLISSYVEDTSVTSFPQYQGYEIKFDFSLIRPEGAYITGGYKAPGPDPLRKSLIKMEELLDRQVTISTRISSILAYDLLMHMSDAVLSGGVRRSATICFFDYDDIEMMNAKIGNWYYENPQRARSNNSVVLKRDEVTKEQFSEIFSKIKQFGEPGFFFVNDYDEVSNPCIPGDQLITTNKGLIPMSELVVRINSGESIDALSFNEDTKVFEMKEITAAAMTKRDAQLVELEIDTENGIKTIRCTPDHMILTSNRGYVEARYLSVDDDIITM